MEKIPNGHIETMEEVLDEFFMYFKQQSKQNRDIFSREIDDLNRITEQFCQLVKAFSSYCVGVNIINNQCSKCIKSNKEPNSLWGEILWNEYCAKKTLFPELDDNIEYSEFIKIRKTAYNLEQ
jgi:hypothetical protein